MSNGDAAPTVPALTTEIVAAYVGHHTIAAADVAAMITSVARELDGLGREPEQPTTPEPAVSVRRSVRHDHLVCLVCGKRFKSLRRHLETAHGLTPAAYRDIFDLKPDYPMVAPATAEQRAEIARRTGLGTRRAPAPPPEPAPKPKRATRAPKKAEDTTAGAPTPKPARKRRTATKKAEPTTS